MTSPCSSKSARAVPSAATLRSGAKALAVGGEPPALCDEHRAQTLTDATDEVEVGGPEFGVGRQQATGHQPRLCLARIGKPVRASGQLDGVDQRLNAAQRAGRRLGFDVGGPVWQRHGFSLGRRDQ